MSTTGVKQAIHLVDEKGAFVRKQSTFRNFINGEDGKYPAAKDRYHLYISHACPWANRTAIFRQLKGLEDVISLTVVDTDLMDKGWTMQDEGDPLNQKSSIPEVYKMIQEDFQGPYTVPILFDKESNTIVNNESSEIIRMLNTEFNEFSASPEQGKADYYPESLRTEINELNEWIYPQINNGVYQCGFATTQEAYNEAFELLFSGLDKVEAILSEKRYLTGDALTEADIRLFTTLIRFDAVYAVHFKCNKQRIIEYPNIKGYIQELYQMPAIQKTINFEHIKRHYYYSHRRINPFGIIPQGPTLEWLDQPHDRDSAPTKKRRTE